MIVKVFFDILFATEIELKTSLMMYNYLGKTEYHHTLKTPFYAIRTYKSNGQFLMFVVYNKKNACFPFVNCIS